MNVVWVRSCARPQSRHNQKAVSHSRLPDRSTKATNSSSSRTVTSVSTPAITRPADAGAPRGEGGGPRRALPPPPRRPPRAPPPGEGGRPPPVRLPPPPPSPPAPPACPPPAPPPACASPG